MSHHSIVTIKALEDGVIVLFTSAEGVDNPSAERLDKGEVLVLPAPERFRNFQIRGHALVHTPEHIVESESGLVIGGRT